MVWTSSFLPLLTLQWRHNGLDGVSNPQPHDCLLNRLFRHRSTKTSNLCVTGLCVGNSPVTGEFLAQMYSNAKNVSIWRCHYVQGMGKYTPHHNIRCDYLSLTYFSWINTYKRPSWFSVTQLLQLLMSAWPHCLPHTKPYIIFRS